MTPCAINPEMLVPAAQQGDPDAVDQLLRDLRPKVVRYCRARIDQQRSTYASADDVAQEVLLAVFQALPSYRPSNCGFEGFVFGIAAHKVADFYRSRYRAPLPAYEDGQDRVDPDPGPDQVALRDEQRRMLDQLLDQLTECQREVVVLRVIVGLSAEETSRALDSTPGAVRVQQHRALTKLRRLLDERWTTE